MAWEFYNSTGDLLDSFGNPFSSGGGATTFLGLTDTPATYVGQALKVAKVNAGETALEFAADIDTGITQLTSDITAGPGSGSQAATIANDAVSNAKLANMAAWTFKIRNAGTTGDPSDAAIGDVTTSTPAAADFIIGYKADGTIRKYAASNFGVTGGGSVIASFSRTMLLMGA